MGFLRILSYVENILGIYRNYVFCSRFIRWLILLRVLIDITLNTIFAYLSFYVMYSGLYYILNSVNSLVILFFAIYNTRLFNKLVMYFKSLDLYFPNSTEPTKRSENLQIVLVAYFITFSLVALTVLMYIFIFEINNVNVFVSIGIMIQTILSDQRFIIESYVVGCALNSVADQLLIIVSMIEKESFGINANTGEVNAVCKHATVTISHNCKKRLRLFDTWSAAYATVRKCSELINNIFGFQIPLMLFTVSLFYVTLLYNITTMAVKNIFSPSKKFLCCFYIGQYMVNLYIVSRAAQRAQNNAQTLKRRLATLLLHSIQCEAQCKATRALLRQVATHPIQTNAFGSVTVDMRLLPACLAFCVSYTVIALQYNKVV